MVFLRGKACGHVAGGPVAIDGRVSPAAVLWVSVPTFWVRKWTRRLFTRRGDRIEVPSPTRLWVVLKSSPWRESEVVLLLRRMNWSSNA